jgi:hypothetical protein
VKQNRNDIYESIIRDAENKRKQQLVQLNKNCCPNCINNSKDCLRLEHIFKDGVESYKCTNYKVIV